MSDVLLFVISLAVTVLGLLGGWAAYRRRGIASGMRGAAWSLVPMGAYLTGLTRFLADLALSPVRWAGVVLLGLGAVLYVTSGVMLRRNSGARGTGRTAAGAPERGDTLVAGRATAPLERRPTAADTDLAEVERILKNRGIS